MFNLKQDMHINPPKAWRDKGRKRVKEFKAWNTGRRTLKDLSSRYTRAMSSIISQQVWLPVLNQQKSGPINSQSPMGVEPREPLPIAVLWAKDEFWEKQSQW